MTAVSARPRVLVLSSVPVGRRMIGAAIRPYELARGLSRDADVVLAMPAAPDEPASGVETAVFSHQDPRALVPLVRWADAVVTQPQWPLITRLLRRSGTRIVLDLYVPEPLELLEAHATRRPVIRRAWQALSLDRHVAGLRIAHHVVCASEGQRDLWLGTLLGRRALTPALYDRDPRLRSQLAVVPIGLPEQPPRAQPGAGIREALPALGADDEIVLWNGGIWEWLDAPTAVKAVHRLRRARPRARLVFMGRGTHQAEVRATAEVEALARELGELDDGVFVNDGWVPYDQRGTWLLEADAAISCHADHLETRFAFRTRLTDCLWAGLPVVCTAGDELAARIARDDFGAVVGERDAAAAAAALAGVLERGRGAYAARMQAAAADYAWPRVVAPIRDWLQDELPPRLGGARMPGEALRDGGYVTARTALNVIGLRDWPGG